MRAAVVTVSSSLARGEGEDVSGPRLAELCEAAGLEVSRETVSDDRDAIVGVLKRLADQEGVRFVFTTGGTGLTIDDVTPEATRDVIDREAPGFASMRAKQTGENAQQRRLAGAVWAEHDKRLALLDAHADAAEGDALAEAALDRLQLDHRSSVSAA